MDRKRDWVNKLFICLYTGCQQVLSVVFLRVTFDLTYNPFQYRAANAEQWSLGSNSKENHLPRKCMLWLLLKSQCTQSDGKIRLGSTYSYLLLLLSLSWSETRILKSFKVIIMKIYIKSNLIFRVCHPHAGFLVAYCMHFMWFIIFWSGSDIADSLLTDCSP